MASDGYTADPHATATVVASVLAIAAVSYIVRSQLLPSTSRLPPMISVKPWLPTLITHTYAILINPSVDHIRGMISKYGCVFQIHSIIGRTFFLTGPSAIKWAFRNERTSYKAGIFPSHWYALLGEHSVSRILGSVHTRMRRVYALAFTPTALERCYPGLYDATATFISQFSSASTSTAQECFLPIKMYLLDTTLQIVLSADSKTDTRLSAMPEEFKAWLAAMTTLLAFNFPGTTYRRGLIARENIFEMFKLFMKDRESVIVGEDGNAKMDVLQLFLDARDEEGHPLTEAQVLDQLLTFIFAGHDTSAATICTMLHFMGGKSQQPAMEKLRAEVEQILPRNGASSFDALVNAPYLEAFVKEVLRLGAPVPARLGEVLKDTEFSCPFKGSTTAYKFPERSMLLLDYRYGMRDDEYYAESHKFCPERFLPGREEDKASPYTYLPFGGGSRMCVGYALAKMQIKVFAALLVRDFDIVVEKEVSVSFPLGMIKPTVRLVKRV